MALRIHVDHKDFFLKKSETRGEIDTGRSLPASAFLVRNGDNSQKVRLLELK
jgi:hypothetical protein